MLQEQIRELQNRINRDTRNVFYKKPMFDELTSLKQKLEKAKAQ